MYLIQNKINLHGENFSQTRILFFIGSFQIGGTERDLLTIVRNLDKRRFKIFVACIHKEGPFLDKIEAMEVPIIEFCIFRHPRRKVRISEIPRLFSLKSFLQLVKFLKEQKIDVIHSLTGLTTIIGPVAGKLAKTQCIVSSMLNTGNWLERIVDEQYIDVDKSSCKKLTYHLFSYVKKGFFRFVNKQFIDLLIVNAESVKKFLLDRRLADEKKIRTIYNGVKISEFKLSIDLEAKKTELGLDINLPVVGIVGTLRAVKGHRYFLEAAAKILKEEIPCQFLVVGDGEAKDSLVMLSKELGLRHRVVFSGFRTDIPELHQLIDVPVVSSTANEGLPNTLIEALASGKPGVGTDVGGTSEIIRHGKTGFIVPPGDSDALAKAIKELLTNDALRKNMGRAARRLVQREFNVEHMLYQYTRIYGDQISK